MVRPLFAACALASLLLPAYAQAGDMDLALSRLRIIEGKGNCPAVSAAVFCADNAAFERLASELAVTVAPPVNRGAASLGLRGFYLGISTTMTTISGDQSYWAHGTRGSASAGDANLHPDSALIRNRVDIRKGLPWGLEMGGSLGQGVDTSMWLFSGELKWAIFEGFHSGLGELPDLALRGVLQTMVGASQLSLQTHTLDATLSKPIVIAQMYRVTPFAALSLLFVHASTGRIDLTPETDAFKACAPQAGSGAKMTASSGGPTPTNCSLPKSDTDLANNVAFDPVSQTRLRLFIGAEGSERFWTASASAGFDLITPELQATASRTGASTSLARQFSLHMSLGVRY